MSASVIEELKRRAEIVKEEEAQGANDAPRIGSLFYDTLNYVESISGGSPGEKTSVTVTPKYSGGTEVAVINVDGLRTSISAPSPIAPTPYDDTWIRGNFDSIDETIRDFNNALAVAQATINSESNRLDGVVQEINTTISDKVNHLEEEARWIHSMFPEGEVSWQSGWDDEVGAYLQKVGVWARNDGITETQWSNISQRVGELELSVNDLKTLADDTTEELSASIQAAVKNGIAASSLSTMYLEKDNAEDVLEWLYSSFMSSTSPTKTYDQMVSAAQSGHKDSAIAEIRTQVENLKNGKYVATASMNAKVDEAIASLIQEASPDSAIATLAASVDKNKEDIAAIIVSATGDSSSASIATKFSNWEAGLQLKSELNRSVAALIATEGNDTHAAVQAMVDNGVSHIQISADTISEVCREKEIEMGSLVINGNRILFNGGGNTTALTRNSLTVGRVNTGFIKSYEELCLEGEGDICIASVGTDADDASDLYLGYEGIMPVGEGSCVPFKDIKATAYNGVHVASGNKIGITADNLIRLYGKEISIVGNNKIGLTANKLTLTPTSDRIVEFMHTLSDGILMFNSPYIGVGATEYRLGAQKVDVLGKNIAFDPSVSFTSTMALVVNSDERLKDITAILNPSIEDIAEARIVNYTLKNKENNREYLGSIAQDWQDVLPNAVTKDKEGYLGLDYGSAALASAVTAAREIVALKEENRLLKERIERLERLIEAK